MVAEAFCLFSIRPKAVGLNKRKIPQNHTNLSHQPLLGRLVQRQISMTHQQTSQSQPQKNLKWSQEPEQLGYDTERPQTQGCDIAQLSRLTIAMVENEQDKEQHLRAQTQEETGTMQYTDTEDEELGDIYQDTQPLQLTCHSTDTQNQGEGGQKRHFVVQNVGAADSPNPNPSPRGLGLEPTIGLPVYSRYCHASHKTEWVW